MSKKDLILLKQFSLWCLSFVGALSLALAVFNLTRNIVYPGPIHWMRFAGVVIFGICLIGLAGRLCGNESFHRLLDFSKPWLLGALNFLGLFYLVPLVNHLFEFYVAAVSGLVFNGLFIFAELDVPWHLLAFSAKRQCRLAVTETKRKLD